MDHLTRRNLLAGSLALLTVTMTQSKSIANIIRNNSQAPTARKKSEIANLEVTQEPIITIFSNPGDPAIMKVQTPDNKIATYFGSKNDAGLATAITQVQVDELDLNLNKKVVIDYDEQGRPVKAMSVAGGRVSFEYASNTRAVVTFTSADGKNQASFLINPRKGKLITTEQSSVSSLRTGTRNSQQFSIPKDYVAKSTNSSGMITTLATLASNQSEVRVTCNSELLSGVSVYGSYRNFNNTLIQLSFKEVSPGVFIYSTPNEPAPGGIDVEEICKAVGKTLKEICKLIKAGGFVGLSALCLRLLVFPAGLALVAACESTIPALILTCRYVNTSNGAVVELIPCNFIQSIVDTYTENPIEVFIAVFHPKLGTKSTTTTLSSSPQSTTIEFNGSAILTEPIITPFDPAPFQGYIFSIGGFCFQQGTQLRISIVGTDGYQNSNVTVLNESNDTASLFVPGAQGGVIDTLTATLGNDSIVRTITF